MRHDGSFAVSHVVTIKRTDQLRALLDLAEDPREVATTTDYTGLTVIVPDYVWERFQTYESLGDPEESVS